MAASRLSDCSSAVIERRQCARDKNDAADAAAIWEAAQRPGMRFVTVKTENQQAVLALHRPA